MITLNVNVTDFEHAEYSVSASFSIPDESTASQCIPTFIAAMQLEGYSIEAIRYALHEASLDLGESIVASHKIYKERTNDE